MWQWAQARAQAQAQAYSQHQQQHNRYRQQLLHAQAAAASAAAAPFKRPPPLVLMQDGTTREKTKEEQELQERQERQEQQEQEPDHSGCSSSTEDPRAGSAAPGPPGPQPATPRGRSRGAGGSAGVGRGRGGRGGKVTAGSERQRASGTAAAATAGGGGGGGRGARRQRASACSGGRLQLEQLPADSGCPHRHHDMDMPPVVLHADVAEDGGSAGSGEVVVDPLQHPPSRAGAAAAAAVDLAFVATGDRDTRAARVAGSKRAPSTSPEDRPKHLSSSGGGGGVSGGRQGQQGVAADVPAAGKPTLQPVPGAPPAGGIGGGGVGPEWLGVHVTRWGPLELTAGGMEAVRQSGLLAGPISANQGQQWLLLRADASSPVTPGGGGGGEGGPAGAGTVGQLSGPHVALPAALAQEEEEEEGGHEDLTLRLSLGLGLGLADMRSSPPERAEGSLKYRLLHRSSAAPNLGDRARGASSVANGLHTASAAKSLSGEPQVLAGGRRAGESGAVVTLLHPLERSAERLQQLPSPEMDDFEKGTLELMSC
eukprot:jgi/Mesen1/8721/ME000052S08154